jgi:type IV secretory pathway TraG/TraD family ATPase VirD4
LVNGTDDSSAYASISDLVLTEPKPPVALLILLPTLKYQAIGHQLGKLLLQELGWAIGERASRIREPHFLPVFLDEFSAFAYDGFQQILNKARSSNVALHLSHQTLGDLTSVSEAFAMGVNGNTNVKCFLGLNDPDTADYFARHLGTKTEEKETERGQKHFLFRGTEKTGDVSIREVESYQVHPNRLKNFTRGMGVLHMPGETQNITEEVQFAPIRCDEFPKEMRLSAHPA